MTRTGMLAAAGLVVAVNAFVLGRAAMNRAGPDSSMTLTERELPLAYSFPATESSGVALHLDVEHPGSWSQPRDPGLLTDPPIPRVMGWADL